MDQNLSTKYALEQKYYFDCAKRKIIPDEKIFELKVFLSEINESWIVDRIREDWYRENSDISTNNINNCDVIWVIAPWVWQKLPKRKLQKNKVVCTIHHIDFAKFSTKEEKDFIEEINTSISIM